METRGLLVRLKENMSSASPTEKSIIKYVLEDPEQVVGISIHELSEKTFASPSTISRFCHKMHLDGYREFQRDLIVELAVASTGEKTNIKDMSPKDSTRQTVFKVTRRNIESLNITEKLNDVETIDKCVKMMTESESISLFGMGASLLSAQDLYYKLIRANVSCNVNDDWHIQLLYARNMNSKDLAIAFSYSGQTKEVIACAKEAHERGGKVIAVTRARYGSELESVADCVLNTASTEPVLRSMAAASRVSQLDIVDILFTSYVNKNYKRCSMILKNNYIAK
jgi:DNA-binding MurR/RpiR family transcriptional regulator